MTTVNESWSFRRRRICIVFPFRIIFWNTKPGRSTSKLYVFNEDETHLMGIEEGFNNTLDFRIYVCHSQLPEVPEGRRCLHVTYEVAINRFPFLFHSSKESGEENELDLFVRPLRKINI